MDLERTAVVLVILALAGCADLRVPSDRTEFVETLALNRARLEMSCPDAKSDRPIRRDSVDNWTDHLFSEYNAWVEGCDRQVNYLVVCEIDNDCFFADLPETIYPARMEDLGVKATPDPKS